MRLFLFLCIFQYFCFVCPDYCNLSLGKGEAHSKKPHVFQMSLLARNNEGSKNSHIYISKECNVCEKLLCFTFYVRGVVKGKKREDRIMRNNIRVSSNFQCWYTV